MGMHAVYKATNKGSMLLSPQLKCRQDLDGFCVPVSLLLPITLIKFGAVFNLRRKLAVLENRPGMGNDEGESGNNDHTAPKKELSAGRR